MTGNLFVGYDSFPYSVDVFDRYGFAMYPAVLDVGSPIIGLTINSWGDLLVGTSDSTQLKKYWAGGDFLIETLPAMFGTPGGLASFNDYDWDGLSNGSEINVHRTDPYNPDTDSDGKFDGDEINLYGTDPLNPNS
ncbi:MAG: hypothetical protein ABFS18_01775 [Thermodesulfobacteriota bacterium]